MKKELKLEYHQLEHWKELSTADQFLVKKAKRVMSNAYTPYSKFKVGAAVQLSNDTVVTGSNQENIAYPSGLCAERVALFYAGANFPNEKVKTLCIVAKGDLVSVETILSPCGGCRQVMVETENRQDEPYRVILVCQNDVVVIFNSALDLLPLAFGS
jgi:cytidine deaminase